MRGWSVSKTPDLQLSPQARRIQISVLIETYTSHNWQVNQTYTRNNWQVNQYYVRSY
jgi:hypothetical protein